MTISLKQRIQNNEKVIGIFIGIYSPQLVEMAGYANFDFIVIDDEHGAFSYSELENLIRTAELVNMTPIVRVSYDESSIQKALDRGAKGIQVPMVNSVEKAKDIVYKAKFPPKGNRGVAYSHRAAKYGKCNGQNFLETSNEEILVAVHIETEQAVNEFEEIMSVDGIDIAFLGTTDLSVNMGYPQGLKHSHVKDTVRKVYDIAKEKNITIGTVAANAEDVSNAFEEGAQYVGVIGTSIILNTFTNIIKKVKQKNELN